MVPVTVLITPANGQVQKYTRTFSTMTADLMALADWLDSLHVVQIAMILPLLDLSASYIDWVHTRWSEDSQNLNGLNSSTVEWIQVLKQLTLRNDLHLLTMIMWSEVLSQSGMFRQTKAWLFFVN